MTAQIERTYVRTRRGRLHVVYLTPTGGRVTQERCNLDDARNEMPATLGDVESADPARLCGHCFPEGARA